MQKYGDHEWWEVGGGGNTGIPSDRATPTLGPHQGVAPGPHWGGGEGKVAPQPRPI